MSKEIVLEFTNYKLFKEKTFNLENFNIYLISGPNESGKTSVLTALQEMYGVFPLTSDPLTTGTTEGSKTFQIPDKEGNIVTVKHTYDRSKAKGRFVAFDKDGTPLRKVGEIRELLGTYSRITTEQFFDKAKTAEGRREIINDYFVKFLTEEEIVALRKQKDLEVVSFDARTAAKKDVDDAEKKVQEYKLTPSEEQLLAQKTASQKLLANLRGQRDSIKLLDSNLKVLQERDASLQDKLDDIESYVQEAVVKTETQLPEMREELEELELQVKQLKENIKDSEDFLKDPFAKRKDEIDGLKKQIAENKAEIEKEKKEAGDPDMTLEKLDERLSKGEKMMGEIAICESRSANYEKAKTEFDAANKAWQDLDDKVAGARKSVEDIYANSALPPGVKIEDDTFTLNGFEFSETQISESKAKLVIAEIMCKVDTSPLLIMGNAGSFGEERLNELCSLAEKHNKIMFLEKVLDDEEEVKVVGVVYNKKISTNQKLF